MRVRKIQAILKFVGDFFFFADVFFMDMTFVFFLDWYLFDAHLCKAGLVVAGTQKDSGPQCV